MNYFNDIVNFFIRWDWLFVGISFVLMHVVALANWCSNPYRRQNKQIAACTSKIVASPKHVGCIVSLLPAEYRRQWRAYLCCANLRPGCVMEFVPLPCKTHLLRTAIFASALNSLYVPLFFANTAKVEYIACHVAFCLFAVLVFVVRNAILGKQQRHARRLFGSLVATLNGNAMHVCPAQKPSNTVAELQKLCSNGVVVTDKVLQNAAGILQSKGLDEHRTADEQRKINLALNKLLQSYCSRAQANR